MSKDHQKMIVMDWIVIVTNHLIAEMHSFACRNHDKHCSIDCKLQNYDDEFYKVQHTA